MVKFINRITGTEMWVDESREQEYLDAGHKLATEAPAKEPEKKPAEQPPKKKVTRKK